jgi:SAM-dependent methyltransferase
VLDFGCGRGGLVNGLCKLGVDAYGCDVDPYWEGEQPRLRPISRSPYRLPFDDESIDVVVSTSVLEHAQNTRELFFEIKRILKPDGYAIHLYPVKWYLPWEPHIYVPLVNYFWPKVPGWWLALWAWLGIRNEYQKGLSWREVTELNKKYCTSGLCYRTQGFYKKASMDVFGNCEWPMHYFLSASDGGIAALYRKLPLKTLISWICRNTRMVLLVHRRAA